MTRVLVIEDDDRARELYSEMLERADYEVVVAADGEAGLEAFRGNPTDVVVTDLFMPKKDGVETIRLLRRDFPDVKVLAITGVRGPFSRLPAAEAVGAQRTLVKPFKMEEMVKALEELLAAE